METEDATYMHTKWLKSPDILVTVFTTEILEQRSVKENISMTNFYTHV